MKINFPATREKMKLIRPGAYSEHHGFKCSTLRRILGGDYPNPNGAEYQRIVAQLRTDGFLVEETLEDQRAA